jgi:hypothetical protein
LWGGLLLVPVGSVDDSEGGVGDGPNGDTRDGCNFEVWEVVFDHSPKTEFEFVCKLVDVLYLLDCTEPLGL